MLEHIQLTGAGLLLIVCSMNFRATAKDRLDHQHWMVIGAAGSLFFFHGVVRLLEGLGL